MNDICNGKAELAKCSAETVFRLAKALDVSMEELLSPYVENRAPFELFKSNICHRLSVLGDIDFLVFVLENDDIMNYYQKEWYPECFYLLAMIDYLSRINGIPLCENYNALRRQKLKNIIYPSGVLCMATAMKSEKPKEQAIRDSIPEFMSFNIVESEIRNVN